jgi:hypothetical protein
MPQPAPPELLILGGGSIDERACLNRHWRMAVDLYYKTVSIPQAIFECTRKLMPIVGPMSGHTRPAEAKEGTDQTWHVR